MTLKVCRIYLPTCSPDRSAALVGTIRVALHASDGGDLIEEKPIRFTATFGRSKLRVGPNVIRFGRLPAPVLGASPPAVHATLRVANLSEQIPLQWLSSCPAGLTLNPPSGKLPGFIELGGGGGKDAAALAARVSATDRAKVDATDRAVVGATTTPSLAPVGEDAASSGGAKSSDPVKKEEREFGCDVTLSFTYASSGFYRQNVLLRDVNVPNESRHVSVEALVESSALSCSLSDAPDSDGLLAWLWARSTRRFRRRSATRVQPVLVSASGHLAPPQAYRIATVRRAWSIEREADRARSLAL